MGVAAFEALLAGRGTWFAVASGILLLCMIAVPISMAVLSRPLLRDVRHLGQENARLRELYGRARLDALLDGLTGLGNHRAFQEELARQLEHAGRTRSPSGAPAGRRRRPQEGQRRARPRQRRRAPRLGRAHGPASLRRNDRAFRVGGDEFAIILPGADLDTGLTVARRMLAGALSGGDPSRPTEPFSLSIGVSAVPHRAPRAACCIATPTPRCTGASATAGRMPPPRSGPTGSTRTSARSRTCPTRSARSSPSAP